jgi:hypothetical protein
LTVFVRQGRWYLIDFARGRPTNPARIPVVPSGRWYYSKPQVGWDTAMEGRPASIVMAAEGPQSTPSADISTVRRGWLTCAGHDDEGAPSVRLNPLRFAVRLPIGKGQPSAGS